MTSSYRVSHTRARDSAELMERWRPNTLAPDSLRPLRIAHLAACRPPLSRAPQVEFARRFAVDYERVLPDGTLWKETPAVQRVRTMCSDYNSRLKSFGLRDYQARGLPTEAAVPYLLGCRALETTVARARARPLRARRSLRTPRGHAPPG